MAGQCADRRAPDLRPHGSRRRQARKRREIPAESALARRGTEATAPRSVRPARRARSARGDAKAEKWTKRSLDYNPHWGGVYETLAHYEIMRRMYSQANDWLQKAVATQPDRWSAQAELGVNLLRLGQVDASRAALEKAYTGDPFSATTVNTLRVLDKLKDFSVVRANSPDIVTWLDKKEADAMRPYVEEVARQAITTYSNRYAFKPAQPITIEVYPNHDDFAVRTAGLPGIGLLGVTFGYLVAMDSPSGRADRRLPLGQHALARDGARVHALRHRASRAALAERRHLRLRGMAHRPDAGHRGLAARARRVPRQASCCPSRRSTKASSARRTKTRCRCRTCRRASSATSSSRSWGFEKLVALLQPVQEGHEHRRGRRGDVQHAAEGVRQAVRRLHEPALRLLSQGSEAVEARDDGAPRGRATRRTGRQTIDARAARPSRSSPTSRSKAARTSCSRKALERNGQARRSR